MPAAPVGRPIELRRDAGGDCGKCERVGAGERRSGRAHCDVDSGENQRRERDPAQLGRRERLAQRPVETCETRDYHDRWRALASRPSILPSVHRDRIRRAVGEGGDDRGGRRVTDRARLRLLSPVLRGQVGSRRREYPILDPGLHRPRDGDAAVAGSDLHIGRRTGRAATAEDTAAATAAATGEEKRAREKQYAHEEICHVENACLKQNAGPKDTTNGVVPAAPKKRAPEGRPVITAEEKASLHAFRGPCEPVGSHDAIRKQRFLRWARSGTPSRRATRCRALPVPLLLQPEGR